MAVLMDPEKSYLARDATMFDYLTAIGWTEPSCVVFGAGCCALDG
jgi:hypothetical protein